MAKEVDKEVLTTKDIIYAIALKYGYKITIVILLAGVLFYFIRSLSLTNMVNTCGAAFNLLKNNSCRCIPI